MIEQHAVGGHRAAPDPTAQLVQLRQPQSLRVFDDHQAGVGHVHPTSMTVVATSSCSMPALNSSITRCFSTYCIR